MTEQEEIINLRHSYRNTFGTADGQIVFNDLLKRSGFFDGQEDLESLGRRNLMLEVVRVMSAFEENPESVSRAISNCITKLPITYMHEQIEDE